MGKKIFILLICFMILTGCDSNKKDIEYNNTQTENKETELDNNITPTPSEEDDLNEELNNIEKQSQDLKDKLAEDITQLELNQTSKELYDLWDTELNSLWSRLSDSLDSTAKENILNEQREWIKEKETRIENVGALYEGGSIQPLIKNEKAAELTRRRCYVLAGYLGDFVGLTVTPPAIEPTGMYVDTMGTRDIYSSITILDEENGTYPVEISIFRLTTLEGTATARDNVLHFIDNNLGIEGNILVEEDSATFTVTKSDWELLNVDDYFEFSEKW